jgi:hypothetical protein
MARTQESASAQAWLQSRDPEETKLHLHDAFITLPNPKHATDIIESLELSKAKASTVPGQNLTVTPESLTLFKGPQKDLYVNCVGKGIYLGIERRDIRWAVKELARRVTDPRRCDFMNLKVFGRYLKGTPYMARMILLNEAFRAPSAALTYEGFADSNFGGSPGMDRRSTDCTIRVAGGVVVSATSQTQPGVPAQSSTEAEVRGASTCARELIFVKQLLEEDFGLELETPTPWLDSTAGIQSQKKLGEG